MIEKPDTLTQEIMDLFKKKFPKRVDRDVWICKYMMALTDIHLIEGLIGRRQKEKPKLPIKETNKCSSCDLNKICPKEMKQVMGDGDCDRYRNKAL